jgi:putative PIN family toxin of toxin-antitoxin system
VNRRVVFDTSTLVSAALRIDSIPYQALHSALALYDLCASAETLAELERVLLSSKFDRYLDRPSRKQFVALLHRHVHLFAVKSAEVDTVEPRCRDPKDHQFLALASVAGAEILVSSDDDLLVLEPWNNVTILNPAAFLAIILAHGNDAR